MTARRWTLLVAGSLALALAFAWGQRMLARPSALGEERHLRYLFPEADGFGPKEGSPPRYAAWQEDAAGRRRVVGAAFLTSDVLPGDRGYAGPIHTLVGLRPDGTIASIKVVAHAETPSYVADLEAPDFLASYAGKTAADPFVPGEDVDAISRATITAEAVARSVRDASRLVGRAAFGLDLPPPAGTKPAPLRRTLVVAAVCLLGLASFLAGRAWLRWTSLLASLAVLGFALGVYLSLGQLANLFLGRPAPLLPHLDWYALLGVAVVAALTVGNLFCGRLCPFGALQECAAAAGRKVGLGLDPGAIDRHAARLRVFYLWATLMVAFLLGKTDPAGYEPFATVFDFRGDWLNRSLLAAVLLGALAVRRFWCRFFCPVGLIMEMISRRRKSPLATP